MKYITNIIRILFLALFIFLLANGKVLLWLALFAVSLVAALIFGRVYCGYACPMNTLMIPTEWLSKKLKLQTVDTPKWLKNGYFTWITLGISVAVMLVSKDCCTLTCRFCRSGWLCRYLLLSDTNRQYSTTSSVRSALFKEVSADLHGCRKRLIKTLV